MRYFSASARPFELKRSNYSTSTYKKNDDYFVEVRRYSESLSSAASGAVIFYCAGLAELELQVNILKSLCDFFLIHFFFFLFSVRWGSCLFIDRI